MLSAQPAGTEHLRAAFYMSLCFWVWPTLASAQSSEFDSYTKSAREWYAAGEFAAAAELFREAYSVKPQGNLLYNIAHCYEKAGLSDESTRDKMFANAILFYEKYLAKFPNAKFAPAVRKRIDELAVNLKPAVYTLMVNTEPPGAQVFVDDKNTGFSVQTPAEIELEVGAHQLFVEKEGHVPQTIDVDGRANENQNLNIELESIAQTGKLALEVSREGADLLIDGRKKGVSPFNEPIILSAGRHVVLIMKTGYEPWRKEIFIPEGQIVRVEVELRREKDPNANTRAVNIWPWVVIGAGGLSAIAGATLGLQAQKLHGQLDDKRSRRELIAESDISAGNSMVMSANILFGLGAAAIGGGITWLLLPPEENDNDFDVDLDVGYDDSGTTFGVRGTFR